MSKSKKGKSVIIFSSVLAFILGIAVILPNMKSLAADPPVEINLAEEHQEIRGFGGINIPEWVGSDMSDSQRQTAFGNGENELGLSVLRIFVNEDSNQWSKALPTAKEAIKNGAIVFASPWNPPSDMCETFSRKNYDGSIDSNAKRLKHDKYGAYADHLNNFVKYMKDNGVDLYAISVQNEPDYAHTWTWWNEAEVLDFMKNYAGKIDCRVMAPESFQYRKNMYDGILNDSQALANMDILGTHFYSTQYKDFDYPLFREKGKGKELWMTEVYYPNSDKDSNENWDQALQLSEHISNSMTDANMQAYVWWYIRRNYGPMNENGSISKRGYVMAHFSKYVRPGFKRVSATKNPSNNIVISAYKGDSNKVTIVAINKGKSDCNQKFTLSDNSITKIDGYRSSRNENLAKQNVAQAEGKDFSATLKAESVTTFVLTLKDKSPESSDTDKTDTDKTDTDNSDTDKTDTDNSDSDKTEDNNPSDGNIINIDENTTILDVCDIQRGIANGFDNDESKAKADINGDSKVDDSDVSLLLEFIAMKKSEVLPDNSSDNQDQNDDTDNEDGNPSEQSKDVIETTADNQEMEKIFANIKTGGCLKADGDSNSLITQYFGADPGVMVYNDTVYIYMTDDHLEYNGNTVGENTYSKINKIRCISSDDMVNWNDHGLINVAGADGIAKWAGCSWAPTACHKKINGKEKFFLYFANNANGIGVLTSDSPTGPWKDEVGKALVSRNTDNCGDVTWLFDPAVLVDDDGTGYLYFGGGIPDNNGNRQVQNPKTARVVKLADNMISLSGSPQVIDAPYLFEDSGINKIGGKYYYSYCSNFNTGGNSLGLEGGAIEYMVSDNPMNGFTYTGEVFKNIATYFGTGGNNHHTIFELKGKYYLAYHTQKLQDSLGYSGGYRSTHIDELSIGNDEKINSVKGTMKGANQIKEINPYKTVQAEKIYRQSGIEIEGSGDTVISGITAGDWFGVKGAAFTKGASSVVMNVASSSNTAIKICKGSEDGEVIGYVNVPSTNGQFADISAKISGVDNVSDIYFVFGGEMKVNSWFFK